MVKCHKWDIGIANIWQPHAQEKPAWKEKKMLFGKKMRDFDNLHMNMNFDLVPKRFSGWDDGQLLRHDGFLVKMFPILNFTIVPALEATE